MEYKKQIESLRKNREELINQLKKEHEEENKIFHYFPIDPKWRVPASLTIRSPKLGVEDYKITYEKVGKIEVLIEKIPYQFALYSVSNEEKYFICLKDITSGKTSYAVGRFVPLIKEEGDYYVDFNLAFAPVCAHLTATVACPMIRDKIDIAIEAGEKVLNVDH